MKQTFRTILLAIIISLGTNILRDKGFVKQEEQQQENREEQNEVKDNEEEEQDKKDKNLNIYNKNFQEQLIATVNDSKRSVVSIIITKEFIDIYNADPWSLLRGYFDEREIPTTYGEVGGGSGIYAHKDGYIVTNKHVVEDPDASYTIVFSDGSTIQAQEVRLDPLLDMAVIKVNPEETPSFAKAANFHQGKSLVDVGQLTLAIGNTLNQYQNSVTLGIIGGRNRNLPSQDNTLYAGLYQTDTAISQGNSGGPLISVEGDIIGINTAVSTEGNDIGFAIPVNQAIIENTIKSIQENNQIVRPLLGINFVEMDNKLQKEYQLSTNKGIYIAQVGPEGPAAQAGLQGQDIITSINNTLINEENPFLYQLFQYHPGKDIAISYLRPGETKTQKTTLSLDENKSE